jgi:hypothetical protein
MKHTLFLILVLITLSSGFSQELPNYEAIKLETKDDYNETSNNAALHASNYLFSTPVNSKSLDRLRSLQFIIKWMTGTPDYSFSLDQQAMKLSKNNDEILGLYMAAMTKYVLENKADSDDQGKIKLHAVKLLAQYAKDSNNKVKITKELKKAIEADANGTLEAYLSI